VISCHVTASSIELQFCKQWNLQYTLVFDLLQPLPGDFRSNEVTSGSLAVTWGHVMWFLVPSLPPPMSYSLAGSEMYSILEFLTFYSHFQVTSGQMTSLTAHFRSPEVTWRYFLSRDCILMRDTALWEVKCTVYGRFWPSTATFWWLPGKWRHFWVTFGHLRSRDVIHFLTRDCLLYRATGLYVVKCTVHAFYDLQPLPRHFRSSDVTSGSLPVTWDHITSFPVTWLPPPASYSFVGSEMYSIHEFLAFYSHFQETSGQITSILGHFQSPEVTWHHFLSRECLLSRAKAL